MCHLLLQSKLELRSNKRRSKESGRGRMQKRDATKEKLARLVGNAWNMRTRSRTVFCACVCVYIRICTCACLHLVNTVL